MTGKVMEFNRAKGTIRAVEPGYHEVVAICYGSGKVFEELLMSQ